jgi:WD40 repeat protein
MDAKSIQESVSKSVKGNATRLKKAAPAVIAISLVGASLLPVVKSGSPELIMAATFLTGIGTDYLKDLIKNVIADLGKKKDEEILKELEEKLLKLWNTPGDKGYQFHQEMSQFLQRNGILQMALDAAPKDIRDNMAQSLASLADQFEEFGWILDEIKETLTEIQKRQVEQMATQREQLDLQREQLAKTNLLLKLQRERKGRPIPVTPQPEAEDLPPADIPCPYKGLTAFQPQDAEYFFGRETLTAQLLARLAGASFLAVIGPSGSGKSSLVRAGLVPALWNGEIPGSATWKVLIMRPGSVPLEELAVRAALQSGISASSLLDDLRQNPNAFRLAVKQYLVGQPDEAKFVLVVDQFEEIFTQCEDEQERNQFVALLMDAVQGDAERMVIILTLRADFYGRCAAYPALAEMLSANQALVGAMTEEELRRAITLPAERVGLALEPGLVELVLQDAQGEAGALPMVSHALMETWKGRSGHWLKVDAYRAFGGLSKAIASTAEEVNATYTETEREQVREIFLRLTRLDESDIEGEYRDTRRRVPLHDLIPAGADAAQTEHILNRLADARLIVKDIGQGAEPEIEVAHEALIRHWDRLRGWLNEDREALRLRQGVSEAAHDWETGGRDENLLLHRGGRLEDALKLRSKLTANEQAYIDSCKGAVQRRRKTTIYSIAFSVTVIVSILLGWVWTGNQNAKQLGYQVATADSAKATAVGEANIRATAQADAQSKQIEAENQAKIARSNELASLSQLESDKNYGQSLLLGVEAFNLVDNRSTRAAILSNLIVNPDLAYFLAGSKGSVRVVEFSPDGKLLATGTDDNVINLWDVSNRDKPIKLKTWKAHTDAVSSLTFSPDGKQLVSGSLDKTIVLWDISDPSKPFRISVLQGHTNSVRSVTYNSKKTILASGGNDGNIILWDISDPYQPTLISIQHVYSEDRVLVVAFSPDGNTLASGSYGQIILWNVSNPLSLQKISSLTKHTNWVRSLSFNSSGNLLASSSDDQTVRIWDLNDLSSPVELSVIDFQIWVNSIKFSPTDKVLGMGSNDGLITLWDVSTPSAPKEIEKLIGYGSAIWSISFDSIGSNLAAGGDSKTVSFWHIGNQQNNRIIRAVIENNHDINNVSFNPSGTLLTSGGCGKIVGVNSCDQGKISLWDVSVLENIREIGTLNEHNDWIQATVFNSTGNLLISGAQDGSIILWDISNPVSPILLSTLEGQNDLVPSIAISPNGKFLASSSWDNTVVLWDITNPKAPIKVDTLKDHTDRSNGIAFSPDGTLLASASDDNTIVIYRISNSAPPKKIATLSEIGENSLQFGLLAVSFSPNGKTLVSGGWNAITQWDISNPQQPIKIGDVQGNNSYITTVAFSNDGRILYSASNNGFLVVWDMSEYSTPQQIIALHAHNDDIYSISLSPDQKTLASGSWDNRIIFWDIDPKSWLTKTCLIVGRNFTQVEWSHYFPGEPYRITCPQWPKGE